MIVLAALFAALESRINALRQDRVSVSEPFETPGGFSFRFRTIKAAMRLAHFSSP